MESPASFSGGCACGAVRYESTAAPVAMVQCHCRDCQRSSGGPFLALTVVPRDAVQMTAGKPQFYFTDSAAGGQTGRGFCRNCGSPMILLPSAAPGISAITAASMDDPGTFRPQMDVWTSDAHPWDLMNPALAKFDTYPG